MENVVVNVNGTIHVFSSLQREIEAPKAVVSVFDRSFLYGDSLYEVFRSHGGVFLQLDEHLGRLYKSAALCRMKVSQDLATLKTQVVRTYAEFQSSCEKRCDAYCRLVLTRGVGRIGFGEECVLTPTQVIIIIQKIELPSEAQINKGLSLQISKRIRNHPNALDPAMKSGNYLNSLLAYLEATSEKYPEKYDDALLCNSDGHITEGTTFNIFYVKRGILVTPPLEIGILDGTTRRAVLEVAHELKIPVREVRFPKERLFEADEVFATSTTKDVFPVTKVEQQRVGSGKPGLISLRLRRALQAALIKSANKPL
ncbi:aminotransferase class IV [Bdellovibrionota bacterium FG-2]